MCSGSFIFGNSELIDFQHAVTLRVVRGFCGSAGAAVLYQVSQQ